MAGINAARQARDEKPIELGRDQAYIGVMIDDLITSELTEPYRLHTSRAEYRLLLRHSNADLRLTELGHEIGLASNQRINRLRARQTQNKEAMRWLEGLRLRPTPANNRILHKAGIKPIRQTMRGTDFLTRTGVTCDLIAGLVGDHPPSADASAHIEFETKYAGYVRQQEAQVRQATAMENQPIPSNIQFDELRALRTEARQRLARFRPTTVGQAARLEGVTPSDIAGLLVYLKREGPVKTPVNL